MGQQSARPSLRDVDALQGNTYCVTESCNRRRIGVYKAIPNAPGRCAQTVPEPAPVSRIGPAGKARRPDEATPFIEAPIVDSASRVEPGGHRPARCTSPATC